MWIWHIALIKYVARSLWENINPMINGSITNECIINKGLTNRRFWFYINYTSQQGKSTGIGEYNNSV